MNGADHADHRIAELGGQVRIRHDRTRAAFVDAYGGNPHAEPVMPPRFVTAYRTAAHSDGVTACADDVK
ncbi:hypothetical protein [Saccharothrix sp. NRRL B-16348]|uniref:hypothetical protein n=1 Tax=Saccharothrix sp. NRRL B-16348 TaxID=1415542 RepID=UPI000AAA2D59|nr:hypothetical protein [Saccharothrix sp. NRRL B-16348]